MGDISMSPIRHWRVFLFDNGGRLMGDTIVSPIRVYPFDIGGCLMGDTNVSPIKQYGGVPFGHSCFLETLSPFFDFLRNNFI